MSDHHTYKKIEIVGSSRTSVDEAIQNGVAEACKTLRNVEWFEVGEYAVTSRMARSGISRSP